MKNRILIIEDDNEISNMIADYLGKNGYETHIAKDGIRGIKYVIEKKPDLIILDIMLPYKSGDEILREVREFSDIPIIVVSAKENVQFKVDLFKIGVDDYVVKPFDLLELLARIETNLRRYLKLTSQQTLYKHKNITLNYDLKEVFVDNNVVKLTSKEFEILYLFIKYPNKVFSKKNIYETVWKDSYAYDDDTINTHISNIRKKIDSELIETVWKMGYKLK
ncbi:MULTISPECIES: response regulator transcription factor [Romboutsia]|uniref:Stage 0 sporulation protein A homolog n=1 Tax=Romboutsia hominis TaxID=1507512 RepID=A0A2P2BMY8_9FIRM|nr:MULTISPECIES: response regulator transcription factor [Romboutsia]MCH1958572.1 response regulator transcription factor [Romboutsia hominis]MCH1970490.1 response regulator transcription factor [Romboutsia hominis]MDB8805304.1 response regulator transcription factor [Romboutsia sp. 1001216sp1]MDB8807022.1 response regulator transcription factor [Romboutsia sp. 1001216sp1]MDB8810949.1 response regulator transcription factor [Romboutsia sp. 1001216sp1]